MPEVPKVRTQSNASQVAEHFRRAWASRFGEAVEPRVMALLLALSDLETATWRSMFNWNHGNQVATRPESQAFYRALDSGNPRTFRAYPSQDDGALSFVSQVTSDTRPQWHAGLLTGDPTEFARALKGLNGGPAYYEAPLDRYTRTLVERWRRYDVDGGTLPPDEEPTLPDGQVPKARPRLGPGIWLLSLGAISLFVVRARSRLR